MNEKSLVDLNLSDILLIHKKDIFRSMNCIKIGKINSFDGTKKTAEIQIQFKKVLPDGTIKSYPVLVDCPVFTLQGGGGVVQLPVQKGDSCIVLFADRNIDIWFQNDTESAPNDDRCHDLSDAIALVGIENARTTIAAYPSNELRISFGGARTAIKGGKLNLQNATTDLLTALTELVNGIQGATAGGNPIVDTTGKITTSLIKLNALLFKD